MKNFDEEFSSEEELPKRKSPLIYIMAVFLILLLVVMIVPQYAIKIDPRPDKIPTFNEVFLFDANLSTETYNLKSSADMIRFVTPENPIVKTTANKIVTTACDSERVCYAKAIYYFVRDNFKYVSDPVDFEYVEKPQDFMLSGGGDCESGTLLMANLMEAVGIDAELVLIPGHAFLRIWMPEALNRYQMDGDWIYLDWTCSSCSFGEIPARNIKIEKRILDV